MVKFLLNRDETSFKEEVQEFWRNGWSISSIPDPKEKDDLKYALKACIVERMVEIWNSPPKNKDEYLPGWTASVGPYLNGYSVVPEELIKYFEDYTSEIFKKRNIFAPHDFMFFV